MPRSQEIWGSQRFFGLEGTFVHLDGTKSGSEASASQWIDANEEVKALVMRRRLAAATCCPETKATRHSCSRPYSPPLNAT
ncbi:hypothetical protein EMIT0324P_60273 [Pseudomonas chlororaphis]